MGCQVVALLRFREGIGKIRPARFSLLLRATRLARLPGAIISIADLLNTSCLPHYRVCRYPFVVAVRSL